MQDRIDALNESIEAAYIERQLIGKQIEEHSGKLEVFKARFADSAVARDILAEVAASTQENVGKRISDLVTLALSSVFEDSYTFEVEFVRRADGSDAALWFVRDGNKLNPLSASGGGAIDIASLALRLAVWSLYKNAPVFILDEPFRNLSADKHEQAGLLLQELSKKLGIQIIMVTHNEDIIAGADRVFHVGKSGVSMEERK